MDERLGSLNWIKDLNTKINQNLISPFDAFVMILQQVYWDENLIYISKKIRFIQSNLGLLRLSLYPDLDWNLLPPKDKVNFILQRLYQEKKIILSLKCHPVIMGLIVQSISKINGIHLNFCFLGSVLTLKLVDGVQNYFFNMTDKGELVSSQQILDYLFEGKKIRLLCFTDVILNYFETSELEFLETRSLEEINKMYSILSLINEHDPHLVLKRVSSLAQLGKNKEALSVLKSFLNFQPDHSTNSSLIKLYTQLNSKSYI